MPNVVKPTFQDIMVMNQGHSIMANHIPNNIPVAEATNKYSESNISNSKSSFGLFGGSVNYNTFYPDATEEDIKGHNEAEYIEPLFRLISAAIVSKNYNPTDFSTNDVLKSSMELIKGQSVYCDHETDVACAIGVVKDVTWQESFKQDGVIVPAGINGILKIDGKSNPRIARGVMMNPPSIHSNSVTVTFKWEQSHSFDSIWEFYDKLGTFDENGEMVRRIVKEIVSYNETSLVQKGADPFAQIINDGRLNHIKSAAKVYYGKMENKENLIKEIPNRVFNNIDFRNHELQDRLDSKEYIETLKNNHSNINTKMDIQSVLASFFGEGMLKLKEGEAPSLELAKNQIVSMLSELNKSNESYKLLETSKTELEESLQKLKEENETLGLNAKIGEKYLEDLRKETLENYSKLTGEDQDEEMLKIINSANTIEALSSFNKLHKTQLEQKFPMKCSSCGSKNVSRASSDTEGNEDESYSETNSIASTVDKLTNNKL